MDPDSDDDVKPYEEEYCLNERLIAEWAKAQIAAVTEEVDATRDDLTNSHAGELQFTTAEADP